MTFTCSLPQYVAHMTNVAQQFTPQKHYRLPHPGQGILGSAPAIYASQHTTLPSAFCIMPPQDPTWHMDTGDLSYYHKLNSLWREFDTLTLLPACTCAAHGGVLKHNQLIRLVQFLMGLNDVYHNIKSNILARDPLPDVKEAFNVVSREESHRGLHPGTGSGFGNKVQPAAFVVKSNNFRGNEPRREGNSFGNSNGKVFNNNTKAPKGASTSSGSTSCNTPK
ncbi:hypothetical protein Tco_0420422 [Tanacetum coccineum]